MISRQVSHVQFACLCGLRVLDPTQLPSASFFHWSRLDSICKHLWNTLKSCSNNIQSSRGMLAMDRAIKDVSPQICQHYVSHIQKTLTACSSNRKSVCLLCCISARFALHVTANDVFAPQKQCLRAGCNASVGSAARFHAKQWTGSHDMRPLTKPQLCSHSFTCFECQTWMQYVATVSSDLRILHRSSRKAVPEFLNARYTKWCTDWAKRRGVAVVWVVPNECFRCSSGLDGPATCERKFGQSWAFQKFCICVIMCLYIDIIDIYLSYIHIILRGYMRKKLAFTLMRGYGFWAVGLTYVLRKSIPNALIKIHQDMRNESQGLDVKLPSTSRKTTNARVANQNGLDTKLRRSSWKTLRSELLIAMARTQDY